MKNKTKIILGIVVVIFGLIIYWSIPRPEATFKTFAQSDTKKLMDKVNYARRLENHWSEDISEFEFTFDDVKAIKLNKTSDMVEAKDFKLTRAGAINGVEKTAPDAETQINNAIGKVIGTVIKFKDYQTARAWFDKNENNYEMSMMLNGSFVAINALIKSDNPSKYTDAFERLAHEYAQLYDMPGDRNLFRDHEGSQDVKARKQAKEEREKVQKEQEQKEQAQREQEQKEQAQREQEQAQASVNNASASQSVDSSNESNAEIVRNRVNEYYRSDDTNSDDVTDDTNEENPPEDD